MKRQRLELLLLFAGFFALYALTAQRGVGWGDSAEFQDWILNHSEFVCGPQFSNAHPLYVSFCRLFAVGPTSVTLVSSLFGALAVVGLYLCTRRVAIAVLFGLSQMMWWLSCVAEVQTMSLAMTAFETWLFIEGLGRVRTGTSRGVLLLSFAALLNGIHLSVHNFALLSLPVYAAAAICAFVQRGENGVRRLSAAALCSIILSWFAGASIWMWHAFSRGLGDVLFGRYGAKVLGVAPASWTHAGFNLFIASISFAVPAALVWWSIKSAGFKTLLRGGTVFKGRFWIVALFAVNFLFWIRYFVPDQSQFLLPTLFYAYILMKDVKIGANRLVALALMQVVLPILAYAAVSQLPVPEERRGLHDGRNDARYFTIPWRTPALWPR